MQRARLAVVAALLFGLSLAGAGSVSLVPAAAVAWPASTGLLVSEVQTGGASASDEFIELTNAGASSVDLAGLEVVYVTSTGGTVTRKASWTTTLPLAPGRHLLIANVSGIDAAMADATYSGGLAATGGAVVIRPVGGTPIDAIAWGDATNAFVEGVAAVAPAAGSSLERKPGGAAGNTIDTNANATDWFVQPLPNPQNLAAPPIPAPDASPTASATALPSAAPSSTPSATPTESPKPTETASPTDTPAPSGTSAPSETPPASGEPTPEPTHDLAPTPTPTPEPSATPTPEPSSTLAPSSTPGSTPEPTIEATAGPSVAPTAQPSASPSPTPFVPIAAARSQANGSSATVVGVLTTSLGALESGRKGFVQDDSAGIALYLDAAVVDGLPAGTIVVATGTVDDRYAERVLRVSLENVQPLGSGGLPTPLGLDTGAIDESAEGERVEITGLTVGSPTALADGLGILVDDGTGPIRAIIGVDALGGLTVPAGTPVQVTGPVGQHDSSGTGTTAYRVHATLAGELVVLPDPTPTPTAPPTPTPAATGSPSPSTTPVATATPTPTAPATASPGPTATPTQSATPAPTLTPAPTVTPVPTPTPAPTPTPGATASPAPSSNPIPIAAARSAAVGSTVTVEGVVTAEAGRLGTPPLLAIADGSGAIVVRLPEGAGAPGRASLVRVSGPLADPYGQLEIRPAVGGFRVVGSGVVPPPLTVTGGGLGEATEARLVTITGTTRAAPDKGTSGDLVFTFADASGLAFKVAADASSGIRASDVPKNASLRLVGVVGQHASRKGALDGYRLWLRDRADVALVAGPGGSPSASPGSSASATLSTPVSIATALRLVDGSTVTVEATVTAGATLLDTSGRRIVVQDDSGAIEVLLPPGAAAPPIGARVRVTGERAHAYDAPRIRATTLSASSAGAVIVAAPRATTLEERDEWRLVRISGTVMTIHRIGERWQAELRLANGDRIPVIGQAGAGIPSTLLAAGRTVVVVGIVKRPYPTATDRRFAVLPRMRADLTVGGSSGGSTAGSASGSGGGQAGAGTGGPGTDGASLVSGLDVTPDTDLATLFEHIGATVRVGGLIQELAPDGFLLDDGTAVAKVVLSGDAAALLPDLRIGEPVALRGIVRQQDEALRIEVSSGGDLARVGDLGEGVPLASGEGAVDPAGARSAADASAETGPTALGVGDAGLLPQELSIATLAALTAASILVTVIRRRTAARRSRALVLARVAALGRPRGASGRVPPGPPIP